jgi:N6-adenosine-specific RNA methylase IME4
MADPTGCHLYIWTTHRWLPEAFSVMSAWGGRYECLMTWLKPTGVTPYSWMYDTEHVLFGRIGNLVVQRKGLKLSFRSQGRLPHSTKPDAFYDLVEQASPEPRLEMFARRARLGGWDYWGDESLQTVELAS